MCCHLAHIDCSAVRQYGEKPWYRHVCAIGAVFNILMMMAANLVGFVIGTDGIQYMLEQLFSTWEGKFLSSLILFSDMKLGLIALTMS